MIMMPLQRMTLVIVLYLENITKTSPFSCSAVSPFHALAHHQIFNPSPNHSISSSLESIGLQEFFSKETRNGR
ncbi:unnamed protein product [Trifolium pratense]|uniref:Uncharacterized protein n=1 Tax=Trifolium pratense TaxID=57577 RepID=A0ACB0JI02_TRIPR|nr:unnamed protein product [Trifolium pratense]